MPFPEFKSEKPVFLAASRGDLDFLQSHLDLLNEKTEDSETILHYAAASGHVLIVKWLLDYKGSTITKVNVNGATALHYAAAAGHLDVVKCLFIYDTQNEAQFDIDNNNVLFYAVRSGNLELLQWFLEHRNTDFDHTNYEGMSVLHYAGAYGSLQVLQWLMNNVPQLDPQRKCESGMLVIHYAAESGDVDQVKWLKDTGMFPRKEVFGEFNITEIAAMEGHLPLLQYLVKDTYSGDAFGAVEISLPHHAAAGGHLDALKWLCQWAFDTDNVRAVNMLDIDGTTALHHAVEEAQFQTTRYLIKHGAIPCKTNADGLNAYQILRKVMSHRKKEGLSIEDHYNLFTYLFFEARRRGFEVEGVPRPEFDRLMSKRTEVWEALHNDSYKILEHLLNYLEGNSSSIILLYLSEVAAFYFSFKEMLAIFSSVMGRMFPASRPMPLKLPAIRFQPQENTENQAITPNATQSLPQDLGNEMPKSFLPKRDRLSDESDQGQEKRARLGFFPSSLPDQGQEYCPTIIRQNP